MALTGLYHWPVLSRGFVGFLNLGSLTITIGWGYVGVSSAVRLETVVCVG